MNDSLPIKKTIKELETEADSLSLINQKAYSNCLKALSYIGMALAGAFLFYDELNFSWMIYVYTVLIGAGAIILRISKKHGYHEKYINYRLLAETLRVQEVLDSAGIKKNAAEFFSKTMQDDTHTIWETIENCIHSDGNVTAVRTDYDCQEETIENCIHSDGNVIAVRTDYDCEKETIENCIPSDKKAIPEVLRESWILDQYKYHISAEKKIEKKICINNATSKTVKIVMMVFVFAACVAELMPGVNIDDSLGKITVKGLILIAVGLASMVSLFLSAYYGKQNLERKKSDHVNMARLYREVLDLTDNAPLTVELIEKTAREEILENGNWYSYMKENTLSLDF